MLLQHLVLLQEFPHREPLSPYIQRLLFPQSCVFVQNPLKYFELSVGLCLTLGTFHLVSLPLVENFLGYVIILVGSKTFEEICESEQGTRLEGVWADLVWSIVEGCIPLGQVSFALK